MNRLLVQCCSEGAECECDVGVNITLYSLIQGKQNRSNYVAGQGFEKALFNEINLDVVKVF